MRINVTSEPVFDQCVAVHHEPNGRLDANARRTLERIRHESLSELALSMMERSDADRMQLIQRVEQFVDDIEPRQMYSISSVLLKLQPETVRPEDRSCRMIGASLYDELNRVVEFITRVAPIPEAEAGDGLRDADALTHYWLVSLKTLSRWKSRGLLGFRVTDANGSERVVYSPFIVERFARRHPKLTNKRRRQTRLTSGEKQAILVKAQELLADSAHSVYQVARTLAAETDRAIETVHSVLKKELQPVLNPENATPGPSTEHEKIGIEYDSGASIAAIAARMGATQARVSRVLLELQVMRIQRAKWHVVDHASIQQLAAGADPLLTLECSENSMNCPVASNDGPESVFSGASVSPLKRDEERAVFQDYNLLKHLLREALTDFDLSAASAEALESIIELNCRAEARRERIVRANLRLVVHVAKRFAGRSVDFFELISEGNVALINAIEHFDFSRGFKFSTYLTRTLLRTYSRAVAKEATRNSRFGTNHEAEYEHIDERHPLAADEPNQRNAQELIMQGMDALNAREKAVVCRRFGLSVSGRTETLEQIGKTYGVSKERVRQLQERAMTKMRLALSGGADASPSE